MFVKRLFRSLSVILIALFFTGALPWRELRADANIHGDYTCDRLSVTYDQVSSWDLNTQGEFVITNTSEETVEGWTIKFDFAADVNITNLWNGQDLRDETTPANTLIIGNEVYNATINPGESVNFGLIMTGTEFVPVAPLNAELIIEEPVQEEITVEPEVAAEEQVAADPSSCVIFAGSDITISGYRTTIHGDIYSGSNFNYQGSELSVDGIVRSEGAINISGYSSVITGTEENALHVDIPDLSEDILAGEYVYSEEDTDISGQTIEGDMVIVSEGNITINVDTIEDGSNITLYSVNGDITVNGNQAILNGTIYAPNGKVTFNANEITLAGKVIANEFTFNGSILTITNDPEEIPDITTEPTVTVEPTAVPTVTVTPTEVPTATPTVTVTPTDVPTATPTETATPTPVEEEEPTPTPEPVDETLDSDEDYIPDYMEDEIGTNPNDPDTDGDGLDDYLELMIGYDPTNQDTDDNGILDGEEDLDNDGICNANELSLETDIFSEDTDGDKLKDGEEFYTYGTDPKNPDSDDDGILDGDEIAIGKDPTDPSDATIRIEQTKVQEITNEEDPAISSVEVTICLANSIDRSLKIRDMYNVDIRTTNVPGRIGSPLSFECEEDFDTATVVIHYSEAALGDTAESDLGILWYDEENGIFVEQTQAILDSSNNKITVELEHFSEYVLVDLSLFRAAVPQVYTVDDSLVSDPIHYNVTFAVDTSSNMDMSERLAAIETINTVLGTLEAGDRVSFISQTGYDYSYSRFVDASNVRTIPSSWQSKIRGQQGSGRSNLAPYNDVAEDNFFTCNLPEDGNKNIIIYLTDENSTYSTSYGGVHVLIEHSYSFYTVFVGDSYNQTLVNICNNRGGGACMAGSAEVEQIIFHGGNGESIFTDEDGDGLPDILEVNGMYGLDNEVYYSDPTTKHSDDDGLEDGEEMGMMYSIYRVDADMVDINGQEYMISSIDGTQYSRLSCFIPGNIGELIYVFDNISDPSNSDSDGDSLSDIEDDMKFIGNAHINYIFYSNQDEYRYLVNFYNEARFHEVYCARQNSACLSEKIPVGTVSEFVEQWNGMGFGDDGTRYIIDDVYIIAHGQLFYYQGNDYWQYTIKLSDGQNVGIDTLYGELEDKTMDKIFIMSCWGATEYNNQPSLAYYFYERFDVNEVYGCDGVSVVTIECTSYLYGLTSVEALLVNSNYMFEPFLWGSWRLRAFSDELDAPGFVRYSSNDNNVVCRDVYEVLEWEI
ncbi:MAG: cellulose binding domain-containing protein [Saccharofermentans sp.]|nr:cellulose binding domain-containing protein [Saccharofermentans sp.]